MSPSVVIRLAKQNMKFSAAHFTIFNATERERLHGHNFTVEVDIHARMLGNGMCFDYGIYKDRVVALCRELNEWTILPTRSKFLRIEEAGEHVHAHFNGQRIPFLRGDVLLELRHHLVGEQAHRLPLPALVRSGPVDAGLRLPGRRLAPVAALVFVPRPSKLAVGRPPSTEGDVVGRQQRRHGDQHPRQV